jgi:hypothetical protein
VIAAILLVDESPDIKPMNPAFLLKPGELREQFAGWQVPHYFEGGPGRAVAEIVARRPAL